MKEPRIKSNAEFKKAATEHQKAFRYDPEINLPPIDENCGTVTHPITKKERYVKTLLNQRMAESDGGYRIFYSDFRKEITSAIMEAKKKNDIKIGPMVTNLLRSEHIPYNVFFLMQWDLPGASRLFNALLESERIATIKNIEIEYKPTITVDENGKVEKVSTLRDGTAFDVFVRYETVDGKIGGLGIEVKYTEKEYPLKKKDKNGDFTKEYTETHDIKTGTIHLAENYRVPSEKSGWFKPEAIADGPSEKDHVVDNHFRQIWRNHLLGASMMLSDNAEVHLDEFTSITVFPEGNEHFSTPLWTRYKAMLTDKGKTTIKQITYEKLFSQMRKYLRNVPNVDHWIDYLERRYLSYPTIIAVGGGGFNIAKDIRGQGIFPFAQFIVVDTDEQQFDKNAKEANKKFLLQPFGRGKVSSECADIVDNIIQDCDSNTIVVCATLGGQTGTKYGALIALDAQLKGKTVYSFVTEPFSYEGENKKNIARKGLAKMIAASNLTVRQLNDKLDGSLDFNDMNKPLVETISAIVKDSSLKGISKMSLADAQNYIPNHWVSEDKVSPLMWIRSDSYLDFPQKIRCEAFDV